MLRAFARWHEDVTRDVISSRRLGFQETDRVTEMTKADILYTAHYISAIFRSTVRHSTTPHSMFALCSSRRPGGKQDRRSAKFSRFTSHVFETASRK